MGRGRQRYVGTLAKWNSSLALEVKGSVREDDSGGPEGEVFVETPLGLLGAARALGSSLPALQPFHQGSRVLTVFSNALPGACSTVLRTLRPQRANGPPGSDFLGQRDVCALPFKMGSL